jgi:AraC-like DNA-binding protein
MITAMADSGSRDRPTYSTRLLTAFLELLEEYDDIPGFSSRVFESVGDRVLVEVAHQALSVALSVTHDPDLGLRAARRHVVGDAGAYYYVVSSSPTVRDAVEHAARYIRLINDALDVTVDYEGRLVVVRFDNSVVLPRAAIDFQVGSFYRNHVKEWLGEHSSGLTVFFAHQAPESLAEYERTFAPAAVRFSAPFVGFAFDQALLELPLPSADPNLHAVLVPVADETLGKMAEARTVTSDVRRIIHERLQLGAPEIADVASELAMSMRTLARRLENEGTTFRDLVDDVRRQLAVDNVGNRDIGFSELSYRLGFSHVAAFHRAFRRWTGQTPLTYRRSAGR